jgi:O-antigen/teichoic acid export membrane protein
MLKNIIGTSGARILNALSSLAILWIATNMLGSEAWGVAGLILLDISLILLVVELLAGSALVYFTPRKSTATLMLIAYLWTIFVVVFFAALFLGLSFFPSAFEVVVPPGYAVHILLLVLLNSLHGFNLNVLLGKAKIRTFNILFIFQFSALLLAFAVTVWHFQISDERAFVYALYISYALPALVGLFKIWPYIQASDKENAFGTVREVFRFGLMGQLASIAHLINKRLSFYFIRQFAGLSPLGIYAAGVQLTEGLRLIGQSISLVQFSSISNSNDPAYARKISLQLLKFSVLLTTLALLALLVIPRSLFELVFSKEFGDIKLVIISLAPGVVALSANTIFSHYFSGTGQPKFNLYAALIGLVITIPSIILLIPAYGFVGAGVSASIAYSVAVVYQWLVFRKITGTKALELVPTVEDLRYFMKALRKLRQKQ